MKTVRIKVFGIVQGVFFRKFTKITAEELGIKGWVRNAEDGSVEIEAEATDETLVTFTDWCHNGPPKAVVNKVEIVESSLKNFTSFEIRR